MSADNWTNCPKCSIKDDGKRNLREDYECYTEGGEVFIKYKCSCKDCDLLYVYEYTDTIVK